MSYLDDLRDMRAALGMVEAEIANAWKSPAGTTAVILDPAQVAQIRDICARVPAD